MDPVTTAVVVGLQQEPAPPVLADATDNSEILARLDQVLDQNKQLTERLNRLESESQMVAPAAMRTSGVDADGISRSFPAAATSRPVIETSFGAFSRNDRIAPYRTSASVACISSRSVSSAL